MTVSAGDISLLVFYDANCNLCTGLVQWLSRWDKKQKLRYVSLQSTQSFELLSSFHLFRSKATDQVQTVVVLENGQIFMKSEAILRILFHLKQFRWLGNLMQLIPVTWRDALYDWIARNRYRWFGTRCQCLN